MKLMEEANRVTAYLKVTAEFYDPEATSETVRACVEQDLEDAGYEVEVKNITTHAYVVNEAPSIVFKEKERWISVKDRLPETAGYACLVTAVNRFGQKVVFEAFTGYGDFMWYTYDVTKMKDHRLADNSVSDAWTITHWMEMPEPAEDETHDSD